MHLRAALTFSGLIGALALAGCIPDPIIKDRPDAADADGDGFSVLVDCNAGDAASNPDADERCDTIDNDCDGMIDEFGAVDAPIWYVDGDEDGFGDEEVTRAACEAPESYVDNADDCDDAQGSVFPGADELCDLLDNDCDDEIDEDAVDSDLYYWDFDGDGYGDPDRPERVCRKEAWLVENDRDCSDGDPAVNPDGVEICDLIDNDCDDLIDDLDPSINPDSQSWWYEDADSDSYGSSDPEKAVLACDPGEGYSDTNIDCDDTNPEIFEGCE